MNNAKEDAAQVALMHLKAIPRQGIVPFLVYTANDVKMQWPQGAVMANSDYVPYSQYRILNPNHTP